MFVYDVIEFIMQQQQVFHCPLAPLIVAILACLAGAARALQAATTAYVPPPVLPPFAMALQRYRTTDNNNIATATAAGEYIYFNNHGLMKHLRGLFLLLI